MQAARQRPHIDDSMRRPVITGTDIKVSQIAFEYERKGMTPDEIVEAPPHLRLADVHAALAFFYDKRAAIQEDWRQTAELIRELQQVYPPRAPSG
ncbi:MAG TPA: DUF433 domain-containing protein [Polyangiaceae bacterium]|nr:DUF433 domain-containing protein [Polyangiaceae bacterium]